MPGFVIHLSIANEYIKKHNIQNAEEFIKGNNAPDMTDEKIKTHYEIVSSYTNLGKYLESNKLDTDYNLGFFLHLVTDHLFFNGYMKAIHPNIIRNKLLDDYDFTNKELIDRYKIKISKDIEQYISYKDGELTYIDRKTIDAFIKEVSEIDLTKITGNIIEIVK